MHHAQNDIYLDKNYVGVFTLWDHLFGTFQEERDDEQCIFGVRGQLKSWNPVWANLHYWWRMGKDCWYARSWPDKLRVWIAPPGWRPADVAARFPSASYDPHRDFDKYDPPRNLALSLYVLVQFAAIMIANSHFLALLPQQGGWWSLAYFAFILSSLICLGGVLENRRAFTILEALRMAAIALATPALGGWFGGIAEPGIILSIIVFAMGSLAALWVAARRPFFTPEPAKSVDKALICR